jgi:hypothetical protein
MADTPALGMIDNAAIKIEKALYLLYQGISSDDFKGILPKLPSIIKDTVLPTLGKLLDEVTGVVKQFANADVLAKIKTVLSAGLSVVNATADLLGDAARKMADSAARFISIAVDFVGAGMDHLIAIIDLLGKIGSALVGNYQALDPATTKLLAA